jgi:hypothetical protein
MHPTDARALEHAIKLTHKQIAAVAHFHPEFRRFDEAIPFMDGEGLTDSVTGESLHDVDSTDTMKSVCKHQG